MPHCLTSSSDDEEAPAQIVDPAASKPAGWLDDEPHTAAGAKAPAPN